VSWTAVSSLPRTAGRRKLVATGSC
jgi:hypothetical protein